MKTLSIIVPAYNEEKTVGILLKNLAVLSFPGWQKQIIVVNDGSEDATEVAVAPYFKSTTYVCHPSNLGKGAAIRTAQAYAIGDAILIQDADLEYDPEDIPALLSAFADDGVHVVYGSRVLSTERSGYTHYVAGARFLTHLVNICFGSHLTDVYTCYKLVRANVFEDLDLKSNGFEYEMEITVKLLKRRHRIVEVPISYTPRSFREGKKIRVLDGLIGILTLATNYVRR